MTKVPEPQAEIQPTPIDGPRPAPGGCALPSCETCLGAALLSEAASEADRELRAVLEGRRAASNKAAELDAQIRTLLKTLGQRVDELERVEQRAIEVIGAYRALLECVDNVRQWECFGERTKTLAAALEELASALKIDLRGAAS
jgi:DNA repair ATPase RecN